MGCRALDDPEVEEKSEYRRTKPKERQLPLLAGLQSIIKASAMLSVRQFPGLKSAAKASVYSFILAPALLTVILLFTGCGKPHRAHPLPASALISKAEPGIPSERLILTVPANPRTFNPLYSLDAASDAIVRLLFSSLVIVNWVTQEPGPGLAESWSVAADQKTWTFKLRQGVRWSDGAPFTADDVLFTWNQIMYNRDLNQMTFELFRIGGKNFEVAKVDDSTVQVVTPEVFAPFLEFFGGVSILPKHRLEGAVKSGRFPAAYSAGTPPGHIVGCGPYRLKEFRAGKFTLLERNPEYWVADKQGRRLPYFNEILFAVSGGPGSEALVFLNGKSDACETVRAAEFGQFKQAAAGGRFQLVELGLGSECDFLWFNQNTGTDASGKPLVDPGKLKWFRNKKFRQAVSCAIDRERLAREVYGGRAQAIYGFLSSENQKWNNPNIPRYAFDPARSRSLLNEIGIRQRNGAGLMEDHEGNLLEISFYSNTGNPAREKAAIMIQQDLSQIGIKLNYRPIDFRLLGDKIGKTFDYECALMGLGGGGMDPASQMNVLKSSEELHQWFPFQKTPATDWEARIDQLMEAQMRTLDIAQRKKYFDEVQMILAEELPMIYTISPFNYAAIRSDVANVHPSVQTPYRVTWNLEELYFRKK